MKKLLILLNLLFLLNIAVGQVLSLDGEWERRASDSASLKISQTADSSFSFSLVAVNEALPSFPVGLVDGVAYISNGCANFSDEQEGGQLKFCFKGDKIIITQNDNMSAYGGIGVFLMVNI